jgi:hypothetical protein
VRPYTIWGCEIIEELGGTVTVKGDDRDVEDSASKLVRFTERKRASREECCLYHTGISKLGGNSHKTKLILFLPIGQCQT